MPGQVHRTDQVSVVVGVDGAGRTHRLDAMEAAAVLPVVRLNAPAIGDGLREVLASAAAQRALVLVDDAHRLEPDSLPALTEAARSGLPMIVARRPGIDRPELADLDEAVTASGSGGAVEVLAALDLEQTRALVAAVTGRPCSPETAGAIRAASGGLPAIAVALAGALTPTRSGDPDGPSPVLLARVQRRLAVFDQRTATAARVLALQLEIGDDVLARACGLDAGGLVDALQELAGSGLLVPGTEQMVPAVAQSLLTDLAPGQRRRIHDEVARALVATGAPAGAAAVQLRAARARGPAAAAVYLAAGEAVRFDAPEAALGWYDDAVDAGAPVGAVTAGRAEAGARLGMADDADAVGLTEDDASRLALVAGAVAGYQGRADRAGSALLAAGAPGPALAVPVLVATGRLDQAEAAARTAAPAALRLLAEAALAGTDPVAALPLAIEAAEAAERTPPAVVLVDTPHALGAVLAVTGGDVSTATHLLERALEHGVGGPVTADRHRLLLAWARMRAGRLDSAAEQVRRLAGADLGGRDRALYAAVAAGLARRSGNIAGLREVWPAVERVLARRSLDLYQLEAAEELAVAAARLRRSHRMAPTLAAFDAIVLGLGSPPAWVIALGWLRLQVAVAADDPVAAAVAAERIVAVPAAGERQSAQQAAARPWAAALAGDVDPDLVLSACDALAAAELPWEASRLAGDAAIRVADPAAARRLLERARDLADQAGPAVRPADPVQQAGLSEREVEVSRLVLAGRTHREIGAQLFIAPKTVEHHVARIRTKLGATTRADFFSALNALFEGADPP